ncbi:MAG: hypothetical protein K9L68_13345, partial [Spirochaetales bacterium]|nr:hypothetical protein [Spirochaetales bacterium]MCF7939578.1 hypothetical protein [Spirochaetales bacterium]
SAEAEVLEGLRKQVKEKGRPSPAAASGKQQSSAPPEQGQQPPTPQAPSPDRQQQSPEQQPASTADRVIERRQQLLSAYPAVDLPGHARGDVCRLYGALSEIISERWPDLERALSGCRGGNREQEDAWYRLGRESADYRGEKKPVKHGKVYWVPPVLRHYRNLLDVPGTSEELLYQEEKRLILEGAFFLHRLYILYRWAIDYAGDRGGGGFIPSADLEEGLNYVRAVIADFGLGGFRPGNENSR